MGSDSLVEVDDIEDLHGASDDARVLRDLPIQVHSRYKP